MGKLRGSALEVRLAATLFLLLLGVADIFGAWQVKDFGAFNAKGIARNLASSSMHGSMHMHHEMSSERPVDIEELNETSHHVDRDLLVQDTHVHVPVYAMTAALLALLVFALELSSPARVGLISLLFSAPAIDFAGLWGAHLYPNHGIFFGYWVLIGGYAMGIAYLIIFVLTLFQCWIKKEQAI